MSSPRSAVFDPATEQVEHLAGKSTFRDVTTQDGTELEGALVTQSTFGNDGIEVDCRYRGKYQVTPDGMIMTADVHFLPGFHVIVICPKCHNSSTVKPDNKDMLFDPVRKELSIDKWTCTWELDPQGRRMEFGLGLCGAKFGIDKNQMRDA